MRKIGQELKLDQSLALSPAQIQAVKMLELTGMELLQRVEQELESNPALEEAYDENDPTDEDEYKEDGGEYDDWDLGDYASEDDIPEYKLKQMSDQEARWEDIPFAASAPSLDDMLMEQLSMDGLTDRERPLAQYIIGNINADGYLIRTPQELEDDLLFGEGIEVFREEIEHIIQRIKALDPAGIGASTLQESLLLQLERKTPTEDVQLAQRIIRNKYEDFASKRFDRLMESLGIQRDELVRAYDIITRLNPRPAAGYGSDEEGKMMQITPDFLVREQDGELVVSLIGGREIPHLKVSPSYQDILERESKRKERTQEEKATLTFVRHKLDQAKWFIDALKQRQDTLLRTMQAIVAHQRAFFLSHGELKELRPMVLRQIAEVVGLDISTISRVSNSKSVQTDFGIYPLKFFFGEGLELESGENISTKQIKEALERLVAEEDKRSPLTDEALAEKLSELGYPIARRTVTKYRKQISIAEARLRKGI